MGEQQVRPSELRFFADKEKHSLLAGGQCDQGGDDALALVVAD